MRARASTLILVCLSLAPAAHAYTPGGTLPVQAPFDELTQGPSVDSGYGAGLALDGDRVLIGMPAYDQFPFINNGAAQVLARSGTSWVQEAFWFEGVVETHSMGVGVGLSGDTAVFGDGGASFAEGAVHVYTRSGTVWSFEDRLEALDGSQGDFFGRALAFDGSTIVVGAFWDDTLAGVDAGSVYVFERTGTTWTEEAHLFASDGAAGDRFGYSVDVDGDTIAVGATHNDGAFTDTGAVYVFLRSSGTWTEQAKLGATGAVMNEQLGVRVCLDADTIVAGGDDNGTNFLGMDVAYVFGRSGNLWAQEDRIDTRFAALALEGDSLALGDPDTGTGSVALYRRFGTSFAPSHQLVAGGLIAGDRFGYGLDFDGDTLAVSAPGPQHIVGLDRVFFFDTTDANPSFCDASDGALAACPCGNPGSPDTGCDIQQGTGGIRLDVLAQETSVQNRATLQGTGFPAMSFPGVTVIRGTGLDAASPVVFGDGLRCVSTPVVRVGATLAAGGVSVQTVGHGAAPGAGTFTYQLWVRNTPIMYCDPTAAFNLSNGRMITW
jgi:hypothetical protein